MEIDALTGQTNVLRTDILEDTGTSINPAVDIGQVEGGFVMSLGLWTSEEIKFDPETGELLTKDTWDYKPPGALDIPCDFRVSFLDTKRNPKVFLGSKATGEPCVLLGVSVFFAIKNAIKAVKKDLGHSEKDFFSFGKYKISCDFQIFHE